MFPQKRMADTWVDPTRRGSSDQQAVKLDYCEHSTESIRRVLGRSRSNSAVGCFDASAEFKLQCWGVQLQRPGAALNIPMIGIGRRCGQLRELGLTHVFRDSRRLTSSWRP